MRFGVSCGTWGRGQDQENLALVRQAEQWGASIAWVPEAYGTDAVSVLSWIGAQTRHLRLGAGVMQIPARSPAMTAMTAASLDGLSGGRFVLGLGVSGPQVSEGWHGVRFSKPLARTREYLQIVRSALARERVSFTGEHYTLPLPDGPGKALRLSVPRSTTEVPIHLAAVGPRNLQLAGELADGWLGVFFSPDQADALLEPIEQGLASSAAPDRDFERSAIVPLAVGDDVTTCADQVRDYVALYVGGMGSRQQNFYNSLAQRMGYEEAAQRVQDLYLEGRVRDAAAALPQQFVDDTSLLGNQDRIAQRLQRYKEAGLDTVVFAPYGANAEHRAHSLRTGFAAAEQANLLS